MNKKRSLRVGAFSVALAIFLSSTGCSFKNVQPKTDGGQPSVIRTERKSPDISVLNNTTSDDFETSRVELLEYACANGDTASIETICKELTDNIAEVKADAAATAVDVAGWNDPVMSSRMDEYQDKVNFKAAETITALDNIRSGKDVESNLIIVRKNLYEPDESRSSDAAPNTQVGVDEIEMVSAELTQKGIDIESPAPASEDLDLSALTKYPEAIQAVADELDDVNSVYLFVKNSISNELYSGSKKDPVMTLEQIGANDMDQAALLAAMLRAKGIPARLVTGMIRMTAEQAVELTGAKDAESAGRMLTTSTNKATGLTYNGELIGYRMLHTWVEAYIPYTDYRGVGNKGGENVWIQLDPSFKKITANSETVPAEFTKEDKASLESIANAVKASPTVYRHSLREVPDEITFYYRSIDPTKADYIPSSLPYTVLEVTDRTSKIKESDKDRISISIDGDMLLDAPVSSLAYDQVVVSFEPASPEDKNIMDRYEKITDVPAYLVYVVPVVTVGDQKYEGEWETTLGTAQQMLTVIKNNGSTTVLNDTVYSGSVYAFSLDIQKITSNEVERSNKRMVSASEKFTAKNAATAEELGTFLDYAGKYYFALCDTDSVFQAGLMNVNVTKQLSCAITGYTFSRTSTFGMIRSLDYGSFYIDVAYNSLSAISPECDKDKEINYMMTVGAIESYYEGYIWEQLLDSDETCISTMSVLEAAQKLGIQSRYLCKANVEEELAQCNISENVKNEVRNFVNQGMCIELCPETLTIGTWTGTGYIAINMQNGSAAYMISGGNAGGSSMNFEDLFMLNDRMSVVNIGLGVGGMLVSTAKFEAGLICADMKMFVEGFFGCFSAAFTMGSGFMMRYDNYDFIFKYAEDGEACMKEYMLFTAQNLLATFMNCVSFLGGSCGDIAAKVTALSYAMYSSLSFILFTDWENFSTTDGFNAISTAWSILGAVMAFLP